MIPSALQYLAAQPFGDSPPINPNSWQADNLVQLVRVVSMRAPNGPVRDILTGNSIQIGDWGVEPRTMMTPMGLSLFSTNANYFDNSVPTKSIVFNRSGEPWTVTAVSYMRSIDTAFPGLCAIPVLDSTHTFNLAYAASGQNSYRDFYFAFTDEELRGHSKIDLGEAPGLRQTGQWHFWVLSHDGKGFGSVDGANSGANFYINGRELTHVPTGGLTNITNQFRWHRGLDRLRTGYLTEVRVYRGVKWNLAQAKEFYNPATRWDLWESPGATSYFLPAAPVGGSFLPKVSMWM